MLNLPIPAGMQQALSGMMGSVASPPAPKFHDVVVVRSKTYAQAKVMGVPPEEFGIEKGARNIPDCNYCFHGPIPKSEAKLIAEGFDEDQVKTLETFSALTNTEEQARDTVDESLTTSESVNEAARLISITEHYIRMDYEGNGKACLYRVTTGGTAGVILKRDGKEDIEPFDAIPFAAMTPIIITHRFFGRSIADLVMDLQRIKTSLLRGLLDNLYMVTSPRVEIAESHAGPNTLDDLLVARQNGIIRTKAPGGLTWQSVPSVGASVYPAFEYLDSIREQRTGVTKQGQGIDAEALQNQSATAVNQAFTAAQARMKLIARIFAETGIKDLFSLLHGTIRKHGQEAATVKLRNQWVQVNPRDWKTRNDMTVNVGLGSGGKAEQAAHMVQIMSVQKEMLLGQMTNLVQPKKIFNAAEALCKLIGLKDATQFFSDPEEKGPDGQLIHPAPQPQPDPKVMQIQMQAQLDEKADQRKAQIETVQAQADIATQKDKTQAEMVQTERDFQLKERLALLQSELDRQKFVAEEARKEREHQQKMQQAEEMHRHTITQTQFGMVAGAQSHAQKMEQGDAAAKAKSDD